MMKVWVAAALVVAAQAMTVSQKEEAELPPELRPIVRGGSWFDDMAIERLRNRHRHLKEIGVSPDEEDPEEMFIMTRLRDPEITLIRKEPEEREPPSKAALKTEDTREALRSFMRQHTKRRDEVSGAGGSADSTTTSREFMEIYERELQKFFNNFMSVMLQAEIGGVSIENRSEEKEGFAGGQQGGHTESNAVATP